MILIMDFSIVIITLNEERNIVRILDNLAHQTYKKFEVIVVDSNSTDNTYQNAMKCKDKFKYFTCIQMQNRWVALWRNTGAKNARYENLLFLDADTTFKNDFLEKIGSDIQENSYELATAMIQITDQLFIYKLWCFFINTWMKISQYFFPTWIGACMYSKKYVFDTIWWFEQDIRLCEDCSYMKNAKKQAYKNWVLKEKFYFDMRRLEQDGLYKTYLKYIFANIYRFIFWEIKKDRLFEYKFWHYK